ncbi:MAG: class I SAM-dependent methyltransferase [Halobacteriovoraceae bacterium]|nr:class I SAM-dependent methyltransferase [Halobacteriovoraceae bacterium]
MLLSDRFKYVPFRNPIFMGNYKKKILRKFESIRDPLKKLDCIICSHHLFKKISEIDCLGVYYPTGICKNCGNVQQIEYYGEKDLHVLYSFFFRKIYHDDNIEKVFQTQKKRGFDIINFIGKERVNKIKTVLEIGAGPGGILKSFLEKGKEVTGMELYKKDVDYGLQQGVNIIYHGNIKTFDNNKKFDLIILSHFLEHIVDCKDFLAEVMQFLSENGMIYIEVPSLETVEQDQNSNYYNLMTYFKQIHVIHFCEHSFKNLLSSTGYKIIKFDNFIKGLVIPIYKYRKVAPHYQYSVDLLKRIEWKYEIFMAGQRHIIKKLKQYRLNGMEFLWSKNKTH